MAQVASGEMARYNWLRRVMCQSVIFRNGPVWITDFVSHFVYEETTKGNFEKPQKLSTKSCVRVGR